MKKLFVLMIVIFLSFSVNAQGIGSGYGAKVLDFMSPSSDKKTGNEVCLDDGTGVLRKVNRPTWQLGFRANVVDIPNGGDVGFKTDNLDLILYHNLGTSNSMYAYASYGNRSVTKTHYDGQTYDDDWSNQQIFGGGGIYLTPTISVFAGVGKILSEDKNGNSIEIDMAVERGVSIDMPVFGNTLRLEYRAISARQKGKVDIAESTGDAGFSSLSLTFIVGI